ncbi:MAG: AraC family transcriptional regulator [Clostridia bacterium]|nr:AraC family transcriptional regulator [Clostridia bacterium]
MDLCVSSILNVYQNSTENWSRRVSKPRNRDGLVLFTEGEIEYIFSDRSITATRGTVLLLPRDVPYYGIARTKRVAYFVLDFELLDEEAIFDFLAPCAIRATDFDALCNAFAETVEVWAQQRIDAPIRAKAFLYTALAQLTEREERAGKSRESSAMLTYIYSHYTDPTLSVAGLCAKFFISESQLRRNLQRETGQTPNEYITSLRLNLAKRELICTQKSVEQIAYECGFSSAYYFSRCFRQHTGASPREYRQSNVML